MTRPAEFLTNHSSASVARVWRYRNLIITIIITLNAFKWLQVDVISQKSNN